MITQRYKNGESEIRIESATSIEDAKENGFEEGTFSRFFIDDKPTFSHMGLVDHIIRQTLKSGKKFYPDNEVELKQLQKELITTQTDMLKEYYVKLKEQYKELQAPESVLAQLDDVVKKLDLAGMRIAE
jgi:DNA mismatch repair ATPase MutS